MAVSGTRNVILSFWTFGKELEAFAAKMTKVIARGDRVQQAFFLRVEPEMMNVRKTAVGMVTCIFPGARIRGEAGSLIGRLQLIARIDK
jgi:hypothetical protein